MEKDCTFCNILSKEIPTKLLFENETLIVFKDINPIAPVHLLVVPKKHIRSINDLTDPDQKIVAELVMVAKEMAKKVGISSTGYKLLFNVEKGGGQVIFHLHLHIIGGWNKTE